MVKIEDIQIRLSVKVKGATFVSSWYGPKDNMRFAAFRSSERLIKDDEELTELEEEAKQLFTEEIERILAGMSERDEER